MIFVVFRAHTLLLCVYFRVNMLFDLTIAVFNELIRLIHCSLCRPTGHLHSAVS